MRLRSVVLLAAVLSWTAWGQTYNISTFAGGGLPVNILGISASLGSDLLQGPQYIAADRAGNVFFPYQNTILRLDAITGILTVAAGNGTQGYSGDNGPATNARFNGLAGLAVDSASNLYIADRDNNRIRKVSNGVITTVAGNGTPGFSGDSGPATSAQLYGPRGVAVDSAGNLYIADTDNNRIRKISNGVIATVAGTTAQGSSGDNGPATGAGLYLPDSIAVDSAGNLYIADPENNRIRKVANGVIVTMAGGWTRGFSGDNGPVSGAMFNDPTGVAVDSAGNLYIADSGNNCIREISNGVIATVAGNGTQGISGDRGPATSAQLNQPTAVAADFAGNLYISDTGNIRIRKVSSGVITTVAGNGTPGFSGDNGPATSARLFGPSGLAADSAGNIYIADADNGRVRKVSNGVVTTVAGNGAHGYSGDNGPATSAQLSGPLGVAVDASGNLYIADFYVNRIRKVANGVITTVAGDGTQGFGGDNGPATSASMFWPGSVAVDSAGNLYIADSYNNRIRKVSNGVITTVAGPGTQGFSGDNGPAVSAQLQDPGPIAVDSADNLYIVDNNRIRKISNGVIITIAGGGTSLAENVPATSAQLGAYGVAVDSAGNLYIADASSNRVRKVSNGVIATVAGNGTPGFSGDNGPATSAQLFGPTDLAVDSAGKVYITDFLNNRIRILTPTASSCSYSVSPTTLQAPASGGNWTVGIQTTPSCPWTLSGLPGWITVSGTSGIGSANVTFAISSNISGPPLAATVFVAGVPVAVTLAVAIPPPPAIKSVVNAASFNGGPVSPGELVTIFGTGMGPTTAAYATTDPLTGRLATNIGGVLVLFNGVAAPMIYASGTQVSAVVPYEMASVANASVWIWYGGQTSNVYPLTLASAAPGLFAQNSSGSGPGAILNQDNSLNGPNHAAAKGSIVQVFMTGEGLTTPQEATGAITTVTLPPPQVTPAPVQPVRVFLDGQQVPYTYAGEAPGMVAGVMQLNVQIPANAPSGALAIAVSAGGNMSQSGITVTVQ
jgi:uncharacterized protein (TIGR03437 family)